MAERSDWRLTCLRTWRALACSAVALVGWSAAQAADGVPQAVAGSGNQATPETRWPSGPVAPAGAPNVLVILTDDVGFGASSTFGGPIPTPTLDALAQRGLRYNRFHTTALCSPTRAALLTGRNPHNVAMGNIANLATGYDGYTSVIPKSAGMIAATLKQSGFATAAFGKWHLTPDWERSSAGPFDRWPTGQGFEYYYGFIEGDTNQFAPAISENTTPCEPSANKPDYILDRDLADQAIRWIRQQRELAPNKPFFAYYATGTAHAPLQAPKEWRDRFRGQFDQGWDAVREQTFVRQKRAGVIPAGTKLTPRPDFLPAWASLNADQKRLYTRHMESYAAALAFADHQIGRVIDSLKESGQLENTLIVYVQGDNGSSAEGGLNGLSDEQYMQNGLKEDFPEAMRRIDDIGGPNTYSLYPSGWAWAMSTPFQYYKQVASHLGGVRNDMVVSWPKKITGTGGVRSQFLSVTDIVPTILDATGVPQPRSINGVEQKPLDGISFAYTFDKPDAPSQRSEQVFEMVQNLAIYKDGWWANTTPIAAPWDILAKGANAELSKRTWQLYNLSADFSQSNDLAAKNPAKLGEMKDLFFKRAAENNILPIHSVMQGREGRPSLTDGRTSFVYQPGLDPIEPTVAPSIVGRSYRITADVTVDQNGKGVIVAQGGRFGGYSFYLNEGRPSFHYNALGAAQYSVSASQQLSPGRYRLTAQFVTDKAIAGAGGTMTLSADGKELASGRFERTLSSFIAQEGLEIGRDGYTPVTDRYTSDGSAFSGSIGSVTIDLQ